MFHLPHKNDKLFKYNTKCVVRTFTIKPMPTTQNTSYFGNLKRYIRGILITGD